MLTFHVSTAKQSRGLPLLEAAVLAMTSLIATEPNACGQNLVDELLTDIEKDEAKAAAQTALTRWPKWDGKESVADYATRAGIKDVQKELDLGGGISMKLTLIPAGTFTMGVLDEKSLVIEGIQVVIQEKGPDWAPWVTPEREVTISQPFYMGVYEVTQEQYEQIMGPDPTRDQLYKANHISNGTHTYNREKTHPEALLAWNEAAEFCERLSAKAGVKVWLPTEAQWEYACRAGTKTRYFFGDGTADWGTYANEVDMMAHPSRKEKDFINDFDGTSPVGSFKPNPWGLYDMHGSVAEWCHDWFVGDYVGAPTLDPAGPGICPPGTIGYGHVWRTGGSSFERPMHVKEPDTKAAGFRVVVAVKPPEPRSAKAPAPANSQKPMPPAPTAPASASPADLKIRVPPGCRAAAGTQAEPSTKTGWAQAIVHEATGMEMVFVPAGKFLMGSPESEATRAAYETQHRVKLTKAFYIGKYEVTQAQWEKVMGSNPSLFTSAGPEAPVDTVSWNDCQDFCKKAGSGLRLPTEAEWEYACRAGTTGPYAGNLDDMGWYLANSNGTTHAVGTRKPNAWGLHDMHGNVWEWCQDSFDREYKDEAVTDPTGPTKEANFFPVRVLRGGSWADYATYCRSAARGWYGPKFYPDRIQWRTNAQAARGWYTAYDQRPDFGCRFVITAAGSP